MFISHDIHEKVDFITRISLASLIYFALEHKRPESSLECYEILNSRFALEHRYLLNWILELVLFGRCCKICFHIPPFKFCFKQNSDKYNRMSLKYVWERSEKGLDLGMGGSGLDHSVMLQRMNLQTPQTQYVVFEHGVRARSARTIVMSLKYHL